MTDFESRELRCCPSRSCKVGLLRATVALCLATTAAAQGIADNIRTVNNNLANDAVSAIEVFSAGNTIATGTFNYDNTDTPDVEFSTFKLPLSYAFGSPTNRFRPLVGAYVGYFDLSQDVTFLGPPTGKLGVRSWTATVGGGVEWRVNDWLSVTPRLMLAYSHVWEDYDRDVPIGAPTPDIFFDWEADALTLLPSLEVNAARTFDRWKLGVNSRYTFIRVLGLHDTSPLIDLDSASQVWRNEVSARYQSPWRLLSMPLDFFSLFARYDLGGQIRSADFVEHFYEARLGVSFFVPQWVKPVRELSLSGAYYFEGPLTGYSIGFDLDF